MELAQYRFGENFQIDVTTRSLVVRFSGRASFVLATINLGHVLVLCESLVRAASQSGTRNGSSSNSDVGLFTTFACFQSITRRYKAARPTSTAL
jgi:hypothetical protein